MYAFSYVLAYKDGIFNGIEWLRMRSGGLLDCVPCVSFWIALAFIPFHGVLIPLASWGIVIILDVLLSKIMVLFEKRG